MGNLSNINGKFVVEQTTGYVGVGTTNPNFLIEAAGTNAELALNASSIYRIRSTASDEFIITKNGVGDRLTISGGGDATFSGNVISLDTFYLQNGSGKRWQQLFDGNNWNLRYYNGSSWSADALAIDTSNNATFAGQIGLGGTGIYTNSASLNIDGLGLAIKNTINGSNNNWSLIKNTATASTSNLVFISGAGTAVTINHDTSVTFEGTLTIPSYIYHKSDPSDDTYFGFSGNDTFVVYTAGGKGIEIDSNRHVQLPTYGSGSVTGTTAYTLAVDSSGNIIETTDGGGDITGSGTANKVAKFTGAKAIGDGPITFATNDSTFAGSITTNLSSEGTYFTGGSGGVRQLSITSGTNISAHALHTFNIASSNGKYEFDVNGTTELSLDSSSATFVGKIIAGDGVQFTGGTIAAATAVLHTNNYLYFRGGTSGLIISGSDGSCNFRTTNSEVLWEIGSVEKMRLNSTGLGIGTTSPGSQLHNYSTATSNVFISGYGTSAQNDWFASHAFFVPAGNGIMISKANAANNTNRLISLYNDGSGNSQIYLYNTSGTNTIKLSSTGSSYFNGGAVGIANSSPESFTAAVSTSASLVIGSGTTSVSPGITLWQGNSAQASLNFASANTGTGQYEGRIRYVRDTGKMDFRANGNDVMLFDSAGNVGIGTTSPVVKLAVKSSQEQLTLSEGDLRGATFDYRSSTGNLNISTNGINARTNPQFTLDLNGKVGIGTTSPDTLLNLEGAADASIITLGCTKNDASWSGERIGGINFYSADGSGPGASVRGSINYIATSSSGGSTAMTFKTGDNSEAMRIANGGSVGIGTTSPTTALSVSDGASMYANSNYLVQIKRNATNGDDDTSKASILIGNNSNAMQIAYGGTTDRLRFIDGGGVERFTMLNGGNVGIGATSPAQKLVVSGNIGTSGSVLFDDNQGINFGNSNAKIYGSSSDGIKFNAGGSEAMRLNQSGNLGIGYTSPGYSLEIASSGSAGRARVYADGNGAIYSANGDVQLWTNNTAYAINFYSANKAAKILACTNAGSVTVTGDLVAYGSPSDKRLKENIKPIESALDKVSKLQGVTFDWKKSDSILNIKEDVGFIAQDVQKVVPELVRKNEDGMLSMRHQGIAPILLEAIKELKAEIEELKKHSCDCKE